MALALAAAAACVGRPTWSPTEAAPYDALSEADGVRFRSACGALERGEVEEARSQLAELARANPDHVPVGLWLQEAEVAAGALELPQEGAADPLLALRERYAEAAAADPSPTRYVLAARIEEDLPTAANLLERALELDPRCAWAHYGKAYLAMRSKSWHAARDSIARALEADPGHLRARRLEAVMLARGGAIDDAIEAFEAWIDYAGIDPTVERSLVAETQLDLAQLLIVSGDADRARRVLDGVRVDGEGEVRRFATLAACEQAREEWRLALEAARRAGELAPDDPLPLVQQALLYEYWLDDPAAAEQAWQSVLEAAGDEANLATLLQRTRARVRVERAQRDAPEASLEAGSEDGGERDAEGGVDDRGGGAPGSS